MISQEVGWKDGGSDSGMGEATTWGGGQTDDDQVEGEAMGASD